MMETAAKAAGKAGSGMMGMEGMKGMGGMMGMEGMKGMGGMMMGSGMDKMMEQCAEMMDAMAVPAAVATGAAATASSTTGKSIMSRLAKHPWIVFGAGLAVGYLIHKYRKEIIETANRATEKGKDFVLQQRENLEDIVAGSKEAADDSGKS
jgi:hypothetical protein